MPDTGAPWNIPYVDPTDLVRDYPQASEDLADAVAAGLTAAGNAGIGSNVVQTVKTDTFTTTSTTFTAVTGLTATITPSSATSKILVVGYWVIGNSDLNRSVATQILRGATVLFVGDADGSRVQATAGLTSPAVSGQFGFSPVFLDSPGVATAVTYSVEMRRGTAGTAALGRDGFDGNNVDNVRLPSSLTLIEVAV
jgi:hypothetical protein